MNEAVESLASKRQIANDIREMHQHSAGWKAVRDIIEEMRREAFNDWGDLKLGAPVEDIISIRAKEKVLKDLYERIETAIKAGDEAGLNMERAETDSRQENKFRAEKITTNREIDRLRTPLKPSFLERIFATTPQGAAK